MMGCHVMNWGSNATQMNIESSVQYCMYVYSFVMYLGNLSDFLQGTILMQCHVTNRGSNAAQMNIESSIQ